MQDQLRILTITISQSVEKHGPDAPLTLGHLLNICKLARKYETQIEGQEEREHWKLINEIDPFGQG